MRNTHEESADGPAVGETSRIAGSDFNFSCETPGAFKDTTIERADKDGTKTPEMRDTHEESADGPCSRRTSKTAGTYFNRPLVVAKAFADSMTEQAAGQDGTKTPEIRDTLGA
eukprot:TRINITY_DN7748_c0_g1_i2.p1 TRINITY_DN7748_c0_g1~~TRINITY_DN7748_c0_g1_i2.p1  ORF type:complete len:113 (-),score=20.06 TRINITY_DN7748_c0_g1_i2:144-482(-)